MTRHLLLPIGAVTFSALGAIAGSVSPASAQSAGSILSGMEEGPPPFCARVLAITCQGPSSRVELTLENLDGGSRRPFVIPSDRRSVFGARIEAQYDQRVVCLSSAAAATAVIHSPGQLVVKDADDAPPQIDSAVFRSCDARVKPAKLVHVVPASNPEAMKAKAKGRVLLRVLVDEHGKASDVQVVRSEDPNIGEAYRGARYTFRPATYNGKPVPMLVTLEIGHRYQ